MFPTCTCTAPASSYRVSDSGGIADITVDRVNAYERRVVVGGRMHRVVAVTEGAAIRVDVDGTAHRISATMAAWCAAVAGVVVVGARRTG